MAAFSSRRSRIRTDALYAAVMIKNHPKPEPNVIVQVIQEWEPLLNTQKESLMVDDEEDIDEDLFIISE